MPSPVPSHLAKYRRRRSQSPFHPSAWAVRATVTCEVGGGGEEKKKKNPTVDILPVALHSIPRCESSVTVGVVYLSKSPR